MNLNNITPGIRVLITAGYHIGKTGRVIAVGTFAPLEPIKALIDINEPLLIHELPEHLEPTLEESLPPGWEEFDL